MAPAVTERAVGSMMRAGVVTTPFEESARNEIDEAVEVLPGDGRDRLPAVRLAAVGFTALRPRRALAALESAFNRAPTAIWPIGGHGNPPIKTLAIGGPTRSPVPGGIPGSLPHRSLSASTAASAAAWAAA